MAILRLGSADFWAQLPTEVRDRLLGEVVVPDVEARLVQMTGINEGVGGTVVGE